jgi:hypothetical protein
VNEDTPRNLRIDSRVRGVVITALIAGYGWLFRQPQGSFAEGLLLAAVLQVAIILLRRWVPAENQPVALYVFELLADGATVLMFALGVFGGINRIAAEA